VQVSFVCFAKLEGGIDDFNLMPEGLIIAFDFLQGSSSDKCSRIIMRVEVKIELI